MEEKLSRFEEKMIEESEGKRDVEKRIQILESKSDSPENNFSLFEKSVCIRYLDSGTLCSTVLRSSLGLSMLSGTNLTLRLRQGNRTR